MPAAATSAQRSLWLILFVVCIGQFMVVLDATVVNVALPAIQEDLGFSRSSLQWIVNSYTLMFGGFLLLGGRMADLLGRRRLFIAGVVVFSVASLVNAVAPTQETLIVARGVQGLGAAMLSPAALSVITTSFTEGSQRTKALSVWAAVASGGSAAGLLLGGVLVELLSWPWIFFINVPIGIGLVFAALRFVPDSHVAVAKRHFDVAGAVTVTSGLLLLVFTIVRAETWGWGSPRTFALAVLALGLLAAFVAIERRSPAPLVRLSLLRMRSLAVANGLFLLVMGGLFGMFFFQTLYVQGVLGYSPIETGLAFLPVAFGILIGAGAAQQLIGRLGVRPVLLSGLLLAAVGLVILAATMSVDGTYAATFWGLLAIAVGMGGLFVPATLLATTNVAPDDAGLASGIFNTSQQIGGALGLAVLSTIANGRTGDLIATGADTTSALVDGYQLAFLVSAGLMIAGAIVAAVFVRRSDVERIEAGDVAVAVA